MYSILATKKLLDRMQEYLGEPVVEPTTKLGNWFVKPLFWRPQYALFVSESIFLPVLSPLSPASNLAMRFPDDLALTLQAHGVPEAFIRNEFVEMDDVIVSKTNSRQVVGVLNEFASMANRMRGLHPEVSALRLSLKLAEVPVGIRQKRYLIPEVELRKIISVDI